MRTTNTISENKFFSYSIAEDGIMTVVIDMKMHPINLFTPEFLKAYLQTVQTELKKEEVKGLILTSGKQDFMVGADINALATADESTQGFLEELLELHTQIEEVEKIGKPMVSILNGHTLGGGYELTLSTHYRIAFDGKYQIGLPEAKLGMFPGGGGTVKLSRKLGIEKALTIILQGQTFVPKVALEKGLIDEMVTEKEEALTKAKIWIEAHPKVVQPWADGQRVPGGGLKSPSGYMTMVGSIGNLRKRTHGNYPGLNNALAAVHDGIELPLKRALEIEARYFTATLATKEAQSMIRTNFFGINHAKRGKNKPQGYAAKNILKLGVLGGGMMGSGISYVSAKAGIEVVLKDVSVVQAEKGKDYARKQVDIQVGKGRMTPERGRQLLDGIHPTATLRDLKECDLIIEAVFEEPKLKAQVTKESQDFLVKDGFFASNTSTLPITKLATAYHDPSRFIGIHFFSPVDKMPLVEVILGEKTSQETLSNAIDFVVQIGKIPIVVNDSSGFFTSRVFGKYNLEAVTMLLEGVSPVLIENLAKQAGFAVGPLAVMDEVSLELIIHVFKQAPQLIASEQKMFELISKMVDGGRKGKKSGKGFYDYPVGEKKRLWKNRFLSDCISDITNKDIQKRLLHTMALDSYRCLDKGVLNTAIEGDIGSVLGLGYAPQTGGVFSYIDQVGIKQFVADCERFQVYGAQWEVPASLKELAEQEFKFYSGIQSNWKK